MTRNVAVLGATGLVGRTLCGLLESRDFPLRDLRLLASERAAGRSLRFRGRDVPIEAVGPDAFQGVDLALFCVENALAERWAPVAVAAGTRVIDHSSAFRYHDDVPLVVPEVNAATLDARPRLIANPNCSTIGLVVALAPLRALGRFERLVVSTYQSVSGGGQDALDELERGIRSGLEGDPPPPRAGGLPPFAFNVVPHIDRFEDNGYTREEMKIVWETRKILGLPALPVTATAVRVPVRVGHAAAVNLEFDRAVDLDAVRAAWAGAAGVRVVDDPKAARYPTPLESAGRDDVLVGRLRRDVSRGTALEFFVASDNLRKGAALNAVQIAEALDRVEAATR